RRAPRHRYRRTDNPLHGPGQVRGRAQSDLAPRHRGYRRHLFGISLSRDQSPLPDERTPMGLKVCPLAQVGSPPPPELQFAPQMPENPVNGLTVTMHAPKLQALCVAGSESDRVQTQWRTLDIDGARVAGNGETITWRLTEKTLRRDAGAGAQPIIDGVRSLAFAYLDASGEPVRAPDEIRTVVVTLVTEAVWDLADRSVVTTFATRVRL